MSAPAQSNPAPVEDRHQLVEYLEGGCRPPAQWRIGTEHEKFVFNRETLRPVPYEGPSGIGAFLQALQRFGWAPVEEQGRVVALRRDHCSITLEPGGQLELSGEPLETLHQSCDEINGHLAEVREVAAELGVALLGLGFNPKWGREDFPRMPKQRYAIMHAYMPKRGQLGLDMMLRTCGAQVNLDFESEADMVSKFRIGLALQPVATALFAFSPFVDGRESGYLSFRSRVWMDTDPDRCGVPAFVFDSGMGFEPYVDYALDVPMYFVYREGRYIDASGQSFRDFLDGRLPALPGERPTLGDWEDHLTTLFPEVRLKRFLEMRGADAGPWRRLCALPALWTGLLYEPSARGAAEALIADWRHDEILALRERVPATGLHTAFRGRPLADWAREVLEIAAAGLEARARRSRTGLDEVHYLDELREIVERGRTPADELLAHFRGRWQGSVDAVFREYAY